MKLQLDKHMETLFLLCATPISPNHKEEVIEELEALGIDGPSFYMHHYQIVEEYYSAFEKHKIDSLGSKLLFEMDDFLLSFCAYIFWRHPDWYAALDTFSEDSIRNEVKKLFGEVLESREDPISILEDMGLSDSAKWQMTVLLNKPKQQLLRVTFAVNENIQAFEKAEKKLGDRLNDLLENFSKAVENEDKTGLLRVSKQIDENAIIIPTLALPVAGVDLDGAFFCGLLNEKVFKSSGVELSKEELIMTAKCFSDKSKIQILQTLKSESIYSLEIAEKVGLTPATVSHHMSMLLATGLVEAIKKEGKVYYYLSEAGIKSYIAGITKLFLSK